MSILNNAKGVKNIDQELLKAAQNGNIPISYGDFGKIVGIWRMLRTKGVLDLLSKGYKAQKPPIDLTYILKNKRYGLPSQIGGQPAKPPAPWQRQLAHSELQKIIDAYCPGTPNPYDPSN
jgi:hypothetical protein